MSVRAYRINEIKREKNSTFNMWNDINLRDFLEANDCLDKYDDGGQVEVSVELLKEAIRELELDKEIIKAIKKDIKWAEKKGEDYILYDCY
jgi:hypothetical protein